MNILHPRPIHPGLVRAYFQTRYAFQGPQGEVSLHIHQPNAELRALMQSVFVNTAAFITAYNPFSSTELSPEENQAAQASLKEDLKALGCQTFPGAGHDPNGKWPAEPSLLVLGIALEQANTLAVKCGQNGFVWISSREALPTLRLMGPLLIPDDEEIQAWIGGCPADEEDRLRSMIARDLAALMTVSDNDRRHWVFQDQWDLGKPWPSTRPDGSTMATGTELDRQFKLIAAGLGAPQFSDVIRASA